MKECGIEIFPFNNTGLQKSNTVCEKEAISLSSELEDNL